MFLALLPSREKASFAVVSRYMPVLCKNASVYRCSLCRGTQGKLAGMGSESSPWKLSTVWTEDREDML